jgi:protein SON
MSAWATSKYTPGQFLGSTEVNVLSQRELAAGSQAWAKRDQLLNTAPVTSGMGMHLLRKMGWSPGQGLGKDQNGSLTPLLLELKLDKRGLEANEEMLRQSNKGMGKNRGGGGPRAKPGPIPMDALMQKHPVALLGELASKRRWGAPNYTLVNESGPPHQKNFIFKVSNLKVVYLVPI